MNSKFLGQIFKNFKGIKETPHNQDLTNFLSNNESFVKGALKVHDLKNKFWQKLDEAAFPEDYELKKIENKNKGNNGKK